MKSRKRVLVFTALMAMSCSCQGMENERASSLSDMPDEVLMGILGHLPLRSLAFLSLANHRLEDLAQDEQLWRHYYQEHFGTGRAPDKDQSWKDLYKNESTSYTVRLSVLAPKETQYPGLSRIVVTLFQGTRLETSNVIPQQRQDGQRFTITNELRLNPCQFKDGKITFQCFFDHGFISTQAIDDLLKGKKIDDTKDMRLEFQGDLKVIDLRNQNHKLEAIQLNLVKKKILTSYTVKKDACPVVEKQADPKI